MFTRKQWVKASEEQKSVSQSNATSKIPHHVTGKNMKELIQNLKQNGFDMDSADQHSPSEYLLKVAVYSFLFLYKVTLS